MAGNVAVITSGAVDQRIMVKPRAGSTRLIADIDGLELDVSSRNPSMEAGCITEADVIFIGNARHPLAIKRRRRTTWGVVVLVNMVPGPLLAGMDMRIVKRMERCTVLTLDADTVVEAVAPGGELYAISYSFQKGVQCTLKSRWEDARRGVAAVA